MKYVSGETARVGDSVRLGTRESGVVVCSIDAGEYSDEYSSNDWRYLEKGILVELECTGLVHFPEEDPELRLFERGL